MPDIFISYAREDSDFVGNLTESLRKRDRDVWVDLEGIYAGEEFWARICAAIEASDTFAFVISPDSVESDYCRRELDHAIANNKRIIPILRRDVRVEALSQPLASRQWIFFREADELEASVQSLVAAIDTDVDWVRVHTRLLVRAIEWERKSRDDSFVLRGRDLQDAEQWQAASPGKEPKPVSLHSQFILASRRAATKRQRRILVAVTAGLVVAIALALVAEYQRREKEQQRQVAVARQLASQSELVFKEHPSQLELSILLALESLKGFGSFSIDGDRVLRNGLPLLTSVMLQETRGPITGFTISPDARFLAIQSGVEEANALEVYNVSSEGHLFGPLSWDSVANLAFSPDGHSLAIATSDNVVRVVGLPDGERILEFPHGTDVGALAFSPDGRYLVTTSEHMVRAWDIAARKERWHKSVNDTLMTQVAFDSEAKCLAMITKRTVQVRDMKNGSLIWATRHFADDPCRVALSPSGRYVASGGDHFHVQIWDVNKRDAIGHIPLGSAPIGFAFSPDDRFLAYRCLYNSICLWDTVSKGDVWRLVHGDFVRAVAFSPDQCFIATGDQDGTARIWDFRSFREIVRIPHENVVTDVAFCQKGEMLFSTDYSGTAKLSRVRGSLLSSGIFPGSRKEMVRAMSLSPDGKNVAILLSTGVDPEEPFSLEIWQRDQDRRVTRQTEVGATRIAFSHDGKFLASSGKSPVRLWDTVSGKECNKIFHEGFVRSLDFSPDGRYLSFGLDDGFALVWDLAENKEVARLKHPYGVDFIAFSPDGKFVVTTDGASSSGRPDNNAYIWEVMSGRLVSRLLHSDLVSALAFSRDGAYVATGSNDGNARLWRIPDGKELKKILHEGAVTHLALSPDGRYFATNVGRLVSFGIRDQHINVWDTSDGRRTMTASHEDIVNHIAFTPDSKFLASQNYDSVRIWELGKGKEVVRISDGKRIQGSVLSKDGTYVVVNNESFVQFTYWRPDDLFREACARLTRNLSGQEWEYYIGGTHHKTCPGLP